MGPKAPGTGPRLDRPLSVHAGPATSPGATWRYRYTRTRIEGSLALGDAVAPGEGAPTLAAARRASTSPRLLVDDSYRVAAQTPRFRVLRR